MNKIAKRKACQIIFGLESMCESHSKKYESESVIQFTILCVEVKVEYSKENVSNFLILKLYFSNKVVRDLGVKKNK